MSLDLRKLADTAIDAAIDLETGQRHEGLRTTYRALRTYFQDSDQAVLISHFSFFCMVPVEFSDLCKSAGVQPPREWPSFLVEELRRVLLKEWTRKRHSEKELLDLWKYLTNMLKPRARISRENIQRTKLLCLALSKTAMTYMPRLQHLAIG